MLRRAMDVNINDLPSVIYSCFVLHNFCEMNGKSLTDDEVACAVSHERFSQPAQTPSSECNNVEGKRIRRLLATYFDP